MRLSEMHVNGRGAHSFAASDPKSIYSYLLSLLSATADGGDLDASTAHEKEISLTKAVQTTKNIKSVSNFALLP